jgi:hypothetical protein
MRTDSKIHAMKFSNVRLILSGFLLVLLSFVHNAPAQGLYTARGYWEETTKETYRAIKQKQSNREPLTDDERAYVDDFETYLRNYWLRLSEDEKNKYEQMKATWDRELLGPVPSIAPSSTGEYDWRGRDRAINVFYGAYYGASLATLFEADEATVFGTALVTGGLWVLGPFINPKKYENIDRTVIRASNTGKFLGLINGGALGYTIFGGNEGNDRAAFALSSLGSIAMGEWGFQMQKRKRLSEGHIEMFRHYGIVGPWLGLSLAGALGADDTRVIAGSVLAGSVGGLLIGNQQAKKYNYTRGDVENISTLSIATTGLGFAVVAETLEEDFSNAIILIPAAGTVLGTLWGQKSVKGVNLTNRQGSTIAFSALGAGVVGLGLAALFETESPGLVIGLPSAMALVTQQILFNKYKRENRSRNISFGSDRDLPYRLSFDLTPGNYLVNKRIPATGYLHGTTPHVSNPLASVRLSF